MDYLFKTLLVLLSISSFGQNQYFAKYKKNENEILASDSNVFIFGPYEKTVTSPKVRTVNANGHRYKISVMSSKEGKVGEVTDSTGALKATILLYGERYSLLFPDGKKLTYKYTRDQWAYERDGNVVLTAGFSNADQVRLTYLDATVKDDEIVHIAFLERCSYIMKSRSYSGVAAGSIVLRALMMLH